MSRLINALFLVGILLVLFVTSCGEEKIDPEEAISNAEEILPEALKDNALSPTIIEDKFNDYYAAEKQEKKVEKTEEKLVAPKLKLAKGVYLISSLPPGIYISAENGKGLFKLKKRGKAYTQVQGKVMIYNAYPKQPIRLLTANEQRIVSVKPGKKILFDAGTCNGVKFLKGSRKEGRLRVSI